MPCCHLSPGPAGFFFASIQDDAQQFAIYVGGGTPHGRVLLPTFLTSALHLEMKLWKPTPFTYWENDGQRNSWAVMRVVMGRDTFVDHEKRAVFDLLCKLPSSRTPNYCVLKQYDGWLLDTVLHLRTLGLQPQRDPNPAGTKRQVSALASIGRAQKLLNIFLKYELCWQVAGQWVRGVVQSYAPPRTPDLQRFLCALHAPLDSIILKEIAGLPLGQWLREEGLQESNGNIQQSSNGSFRPWSKLDCLRTYYGLQLMLRRIAMATWPKGCACSASPDQAIKDCADWFKQKYGALSSCKGKDWIQAASALGNEVDVIDKTLAVLRGASTSADAPPLPTKSIGLPRALKIRSHQQSVPSKAVQGCSPKIHLEEGPKAYIKIVDGCVDGNDGMICLHKNPHIWLKNQNASPRYLIGEILAAGGNFTTGNNYIDAPGGVPNCVGGSNYQGGVRFGSDVDAVRYLKRYFTVMACPGNQQFDQAWVNKC